MGIRFEELNLAPPLAKALVTLKFTEPTPIQMAAIPAALAGRDLIACAQTGSGKTVAFALPILARLLTDKIGTALVLVPTRELAVQVTEVFRKLTFHAPQVRIVSLIGGTPLQPQVRALSTGFRVIVGTPGRLLDHLERKSLSLQTLINLTLDEADRMLDLGFAPQLKEIFKHLPDSHQTFLFSATLPPNILSLTSSLLHDPLEIKISKSAQAAPAIEEKSIHLKQEVKNEALLSQVKSREGSILIFVRTQKRADRLALYLEKHEIPVAFIHGGRTQGQRNRALDAFRKEEVRILVATDVAGRGIDIDHVAHVINFDLPQVPDDYVHRIGRTGRAGRAGSAISFISPEERGLWSDIQAVMNGKKASVEGGPLPARANREFGHGASTSGPDRKHPVNPSAKAKRKFKPKRAKPAR